MAKRTACLPFASVGKCAKEHVCLTSGAHLRGTATHGWNDSGRLGVIVSFIIGSHAPSPPSPRHTALSRASCFPSLSRIASHARRQGQRRPRRPGIRVEYHRGAGTVSHLATGAWGQEASRICFRSTRISANPCQGRGQVTTARRDQNHRSRHGPRRDSGRATGSTASARAQRSRLMPVDGCRCRPRHDGVRLGFLAVAAAAGRGCPGRGHCRSHVESQWTWPVAYERP